MKTVEINTADGSVPAYLFDNPGPTVLFFIDGIGMRPAIQDVAARIAKHGYRVLAPDLFYRIGPYVAPNPATMFSDPAIRSEWWAKITPVATTANFMLDTAAFLDYLNVPKVGCVGYCMGGRIALLAAATFPDRIGAAAAYHPGGLVTDKPDSPHLLASQIKATIYVGGAMEDPTFDEAAHKTLDEALTKAGVDHTIETYPAKHGWVPSDTPVYDAAQAERSYETLFALFDRALR
jgi:carboxymethylenebutenolidase